jgi:nitrite reductase (NADH) small subunit
MTWTDVCSEDDLLPDRGMAALVGGAQVALFRLTDGPVVAVGNGDPTTGANVLSRGLVGSRGDRAVVFSPLHKQAFDLVTGECLDVPGVSIPAYPVRVRDGRVLVGAPANAGPGADDDMVADAGAVADIVPDADVVADAGVGRGGVANRAATGDLARTVV